MGGVVQQILAPVAEVVEEVAAPIPDVTEEVAETVIRLTDSESELVNLPMRPGEIPGAVVKADVSTLELVDMHPETLVPLDEGMIKTIDYFKEYLSNQIDNKYFG